MLKSGNQLLVLELYFVKMEDLKERENLVELDIEGSIIFEIIFHGLDASDSG
jgi:hypothetical protein